MNLWPTSWSLWSSSSTSSPPAPTVPTPASPPAPAIAPPILPTVAQDHRDPILTPFDRRRKQLTLYFAGATFLLLSTALARRSTRRRNLATIPKYYTPNTRISELTFNGGVDAFEALNIASLGVMSVGMMTVGAGMYMFDVVNVEETRRLVRSRYGWEGRKSEGEVEEELEEWIATVLARKERKERERGY
ncbi:hypothetical protein Dda_0356 [Drechslerella dactyloides]|uniref:Altered inheritance of mitochondria protein 11 n=1 Tax=Drechslerella dactyloides TaxID=74499 RepID=A0AAD6J4A8_DREDA|nr:hypothetical protein Dda_0356 [Drechslerella dactyloides]